MNPNLKFQALVLTLVIIVSAAITNTKATPGGESVSSGGEVFQAEATQEFSFERSSFFAASVPSAASTGIKRVPERNWSVLDPKVSAASVLIQSLDDNSPLLYLNTYKLWSLASLTKLLTAVVAVESIGENKKIAIDGVSVASDGEAGNLKSGEVYTVRDLLKIMLLTSSNDAAAAFENHLGKEEFLRLVRQKIREIGMTQTQIYDASGLDDRNSSTASDLLLLTKYIVEKEPQLFNWTRVLSQLIQPLNDVTSRAILNINSLVEETGFLGGKTGTSEKAGQNEVAIFSSNNGRMAVIILGSRDRDGEIRKLLEWVKEAYVFP